MRTTLKIAWRNIWRTPLRSLIVIGSIVLGIWAGIFVVAFCYGLNNQRTVSSIESAISHIQIHHPEFRENFESKYSLENSNEIVSTIETEEQVKSFSFRSILFGMINSPVKSNGVQIIGVHEEQEKNVTNLHSKIIDGSYFDVKRKNAVVIGEALAKKLKVRLRSKVVLTFQDKDNNIVSGAFRVCGIFKTQYTKYDETHIFVRNSDLHRLTESESYHQLALLCYQLDDVESVAISLKKQLNNYEVSDWKQISPELAYADEVMETWLFLIMVIIMLALIFGIVNTMLMAVFERRKELGMLMAIGMNKSKVFILILTETLMLSCVGAPTGMLLGALTVKITSTTGIDLSIVGEGLQSVGLGNIVYPVIDPWFYLFIGVLVFVFTLIAAIYPSKKALKLKPTETIRTI